MSKIKTMIRLLKTPKKLIYPLGQNGFLNWIPDKPYLKLLYYCELGEKLDIDQPCTFSEKLQWLKLYDRQARYTELVDKCAVKDYVARIIGEQYIIKNIGVWNNIDEIDYDQLPDQFVLKCNHDSGGYVICKDKKSFDQQKAKKKLAPRMKRNAYYSSREWPYKKIKRKVFAEEYIQDSNNNDLIDYKFYCFMGIPQYCQVIKDRNSNETIDFYDMNWEYQEFTGLGLNSLHGEKIARPKNFDDMISIATQLAEGTRFVRVDLYNIEGKIYFGEFTLYPKSGLGRFNPENWNEIIGSMILL